jgi:2-polyprenyl-3-methyl-5-hydroxy-6-metoxy-1,4-benzoquinol methylase
MKIKNYYTKEYFQKRKELSFHLAESLSSLLKKAEVKKILEVGCGTGSLLRYLKEKEFDIVGCDISNEAIRLSGQVKAPATCLPFDAQKFDAVIAISLIEHLTKKEGLQFLKEAKRVLKKNGRLFLVTPNFASPFRIIRKSRWYGYRDPTHLTFYTPKTIKEILAKNGFSDFKFTFPIPPKVTFDWPIHPSVYRLPKPILFLLNYLFISSPLAFLRDSIWIYAKKKD